jgi:hypothetical protein
LAFSFSRISSLIGAPTAINGIITQIENAVNSVLARTDPDNNQMSVDLDMNSRHIYNLPAPAGDFEPLRLADVGEFITPITGRVWVWQLKYGLLDYSMYTTVEAAVPPSTSSRANIAWTSGGQSKIGDSLYTVIKDATGWTTPEMQAFYGYCGDLSF